MRRLTLSLQCKTIATAICGNNAKKKQTMQNEMNHLRECAPCRSRQVMLQRMAQHYPERPLENDDELFDALVEYDTSNEQRYNDLSQGQYKLANLFNNNPKVGLFVSDIVEGEDPMLSCVRHFGMDVMACANDEGRLGELRQANEEYLSGIRRHKQIEEDQRQNVKRSRQSIARFKKAKEMSQDEFDDFIDNVYHLCEHVFIGDFTFDVLDNLYKGVRYDTDVSCAKEDGEIKGRNERISADKRTRKENTITQLHHKASTSSDDNLTPAFGRRRRRSVWEL